ncbi:MAG: DUF1080 domain-containing protein [Prevotellaceae bacterium]|jgi:hypothetical protein|nr:DUF1080 domain-containing protein [Prevotellaceae bacterium]
MKKILFLVIVSVLLAGGFVAQAQTPTGRTATTLIADVLAQVPAPDEATALAQSDELLSTGENGLLQLLEMLNTPDERRAKVEILVAGLTHFVTAQGQEARRLTLAGAYVKAIDRLQNTDRQAFIIRQLELVGRDEAVGKLASLLGNDALSSPAAVALAAIGSPAAGRALVDALTQQPLNIRQKENVIRAVGHMQAPGAEDALRALASEPALQGAVWYALSRTGSVASLPVLASAAKNVYYASEPAGATEAYLQLIRRLLEAGAVKEAEKAASDLWKQAEKTGQTHIRAAALQLRMAAHPDRAPAFVKEALKDKNRSYRNAVLDDALNYRLAGTEKVVVEALKKADDERKADILHWYIKIYDRPDVRRQLADPGTGLFIGLLADANADIRKAAAFLLAKTGDAAATAALAGLLTGADGRDVSLAKDALMTVKGDIAAVVAPLLPEATGQGKVAILELLAARKAAGHAAVVFEQLDAPDAEVRAAAYKALKDVAVEPSLSRLYALLEKSAPADGGDAVRDIQQAVVAAMKGLSGEEKFNRIAAQLSTSKQPALYYPLLAASGESQALAMIIDRFRNGATYDREAAFRALIEWPDIEAAAELQAICTDAALAVYFDRALERYVALAADNVLTGDNRRLYLSNALEMAKTDAQKQTIIEHLGRTGAYQAFWLAGAYIDHAVLRQTAANAVMTLALDNPHYAGANLRRLIEDIIIKLDNPDASYQREALWKRLREMPDDAGFVAIFNGKDLQGWKGLVENPLSRARMKPKELATKQAKADEAARAHWIPTDGVLVFDGAGSDNLCTDKLYGDFEMLIDWKLEPSPDADAGIYLRASPQVQIWNIARTDVGAQVGSGGLYNNQVHPSTPLKVADNRLGEWNTFYIKMIGDRVTVRLNGELVVDNVIFENYWDRSSPIPPVEQIELQAHGSRVYYRNIFVRELPRAEPFVLSDEERKEGFQMLFDGTNMHEWTGNTIDYILEGGCIAMYPGTSHGGNLYTRSEYDNFIFRFEFQLTPGANNGLGIRTPMDGDAAYVGMELQILDSEALIYKDLAPYQYHGSVYGIIPARRGFLKPTGEWNNQEVIADGDHIKITLNGAVIVDGNIREATKNGMPDKREHPGLFNERGHIGFLGHGSEVKFRNIRIKELGKKK